MGFLGEDVQKYLQEIEQFRAEWNSIDIRILAVKKVDKWVNLNTTIRLFHSENLKQEDRKLFEIENRLVVLAFTRRTDFDEFKRLVQHIGNGAFTISEMEILFPNLTSARIYRERQGWNSDGLSDPEGWPALILKSQGDLVQNMLQEQGHKELIESLNFHSEPLDKTAQVAKKYLGLDLYPDNSTSVHIVTPVYYRIDGHHISEDGQLSVSLKCHRSFDPTEFTLSAIYYGQYDLALRDSVLLDSFRVGLHESKITDENLIQCSFQEKRTHRDISMLRLHLAYKGRKLDSYDFHAKIDRPEEKKNPRLIAHDVLDKDLAGLAKGLQGKRHFESAVAALLHLIGFSVDTMGGTEEGAGRSFIDIIAATPDAKYTLVGGCMAEGITADKVAKVSEKAKTISARYMQSPEYSATSIQPILFTPLAYEELADTAKEAAEKENLVVMDKHDLADLLERVRGGDALEQLLITFRNKIMVKRQGMLFRPNPASIVQAIRLFGG